jgi:hypothetical protein
MSHLGNLNGMYGKRHLQETKSRISRSLYGHEVSEETRRKISQAMRSIQKVRRNVKRAYKADLAATKEEREANENMKVENEFESLPPCEVLSLEEKVVSDHRTE